MAKIKETKTQDDTTFLKIELEKQYLIKALQIFKWENLPDDIQSEWVEKVLFESGKCVFFKDKTLGFLALRVAPYSNLNVYGDPLKYNAVGFNYTKQLSVDDAVLIKSNKAGEPIQPLINFYINEMVDIELAKRTNRNACKTPFCFSGSEEQLLTFKNIFSKITGNEPVIYKGNALGDKPFNVWNMDAKYIAKDLEEDYQTYKNRILEILGIDNNVVEKKERLITGEIEQQQDLILTTIDSYLTQRQIACDTINKMYGLNISVSIDYNVVSDLSSNDNETEDETAEDEIKGADNV